MVTGTDDDIYVQRLARQIHLTQKPQPGGLSRPPAEIPDMQDETDTTRCCGLDREKRPPLVSVPVAGKRDLRAVLEPQRSAQDALSRLGVRMLRRISVSFGVDWPAIMSVSRSATAKRSPSTQTVTEISRDLVGSLSTST